MARWAFADAWKGDKTVEKTEITIGDFMVRRVDSMNWQVFERRELKAGRVDRRSREGEVDWVGLPAYFGTLAPAVAKVRSIYVERGIETGSLDDALARMAELDAEFTKALGKALRAAKQ